MNYDELLTAVQGFIETDVVPLPTMVLLAESSLRPIVKHYLAEKIATLTVTDEVADLPDDFQEMRAITGASGQTYKPISPVNSDVHEGQVGYYRIGEAISFVPSEFGSVDATVQLAYWSKLTAVGPSQSNWLLADFPAVYVHATLKEAYRYMQQPEGVAIHDAALKEELGNLFENDRRGRQTGPIYWSQTSWQ